MILVDTSVWVGHLKGLAAAAPLPNLLEELRVLTHPFVVGELVLGGLSRAAEDLLAALPTTQVATHGEVLHLVKEHRLIGLGVGWLDAHLLAATRLSSARLWTADRQLARAASTLDVHWVP